MSKEDRAINVRMADPNYLDALQQVKALMAVSVGQYHPKYLKPFPEAFRNVPDLNNRVQAAQIDISITNLRYLKDDKGYRFAEYPDITTENLIKFGQFLQAEQAKKGMIQQDGIVSDLNLGCDFSIAVAAAEITVPETVVQPVSTTPNMELSFAK